MSCSSTSTSTTPYLRGCRGAGFSARGAGRAGLGATRRGGGRARVDGGGRFGRGVARRTFPIVRARAVRRARSRCRASCARGWGASRGTPSQHAAHVLGTPCTRRRGEPNTWRGAQRAAASSIRPCSSCGISASACSTDTSIFGSAAARPITAIRSRRSLPPLSAAPQFEAAVRPRRRAAAADRLERARLGRVRRAARRLGRERLARHDRAERVRRGRRERERERAEREREPCC